MLHELRRRRARICQQHDRRNHEGASGAGVAHLSLGTGIYVSRRPKRPNGSSLLLSDQGWTNGVDRRKPGCLRPAKSFPSRCCCRSRCPQSPAAGACGAINAPPNVVRLRSEPNLPSCSAITTTGHRSDRSGDEPITSMLSFGDAQSIRLPRPRILPSWPGLYTANSGPKLRLQSAPFASLDRLRSPPKESRYGWYTAGPCLEAGAA